MKNQQQEALTETHTGITHWSEEMRVCERAGLAQVPVWNPPLRHGLKGVPSL